MKAASTRPLALILAGPTSVGKTQLAIALARRHPFELISADSMQVYRGFEIGSSQPSPEELGRVRIHACGVLEPDEPFSVKRFLDLGGEAHQSIVARGHVPLYIGGTGLYLRALRWGIFDQPEIDPEVRTNLLAEVEKLGAPALHDRLSSLDPVLAERIGKRDAVRIVRALEVVQTLGRPLSELQTEWTDKKARFPHRLVVLNCPRTVLVQRIERRVDAMLDAGWVHEVRRLLDAGFTTRLHSFKALGYREIASHLRGDLTETQLRERIKAATRRFAKRQLTWLRKEHDAQWIQYDGTSMEPALLSVEKLLDLKC